MAVIEIEHLTKKFDTKAAVLDLNLEVKNGEIFGFLGPNGAGKTTTIKILNGLLKPTSGQVRIGGYDITHQPREAKAMTGYVPEDAFIYDKLTGREFLYFVGGLYGLSEKALSQEIEYWTTFFAMESFIDQLTEGYSHGTKQKLVMSASMLHHPQLLIIDEPMVGLDPKSTRKVKDLMREKTREGITVFLCTHILGVAEELCDRVGIIHRGELLITGTLNEIRQKSQSAQDVSLESIFLKLTEEEHELKETEL